ncbi:MAG: hypothetical protein A6D92_21745 [Symbiobacterium thermophilum]|uniref:UPF0756 membrane protein A6D92_21745 n=1 Tax=Symbiobacterium thermophilum TaxID=2734 RepID=A0A1Y2T139_SYMTR|nr:MAG: hypothetical protein A6D92_21745 [Symbiobacterium thermophilum]PZN72842.1 MAG: DUF441 domain-containing protein [Bacillota bacterium]
MPADHVILLGLVALGVAARNPLIVTAAGIVLILRVLGLDRFFPLLERRGLEAGLIFLLIAVLVPFATGEVGWSEIRQSFTSWTGLAAIVGGILAAVVSGYGVTLLQVQPEVIVGLVVGTILGVVLFRGIPVGPLAAAGFAAILLALVRGQ